MPRLEGFKKVAWMLALILLAGIPAMAKNSRTVNVALPAVLNGTKIPAGNYVVSWQTHSPEATVTLTDEKRVVVSTIGRWEVRNIKYEYNAVVYDTNEDGARTILEIRFAGMKGALVFAPAS